MTQPAQSSGHKWVMDYPNVPLGHCTCGYGRTFGANGIDPSEHAVHVAYVAQAAQPECKCYKAKPEGGGWYNVSDCPFHRVAQSQEVPAEQREIGWLVENVDSEWAYCQVKPYRAFKWTRDSAKALRFARREDAESAIMFMQSSESLKATEHSWSGDLLAQSASAAQPPAEELEAQCDKLLRDLREAHSEGHVMDEDIANEFAAFIRTHQAARTKEIRTCPVHGKSKQFCTDCATQLEQEASDARERELREKLLELAESTDDLLNTMLNSRTFAQRERVAKAVADARALLASHWPAQ